MLELIRKRERSWLGHWLRRNCLLKDALECMINGKKIRGRRRYQMIDNIMINGLYEDTKGKAYNVMINGLYEDTKRKDEKRVEWRMLSLEWKTCPWAEHYDWLIINYFIFVTSYYKSSVVFIIYWFQYVNSNKSVAVAWSVESLPSSPASRVRFPSGLGILILILWLGVCLLSVFCTVLSPAEALTLCWPHIQGVPPLCIYLVFRSIDNSSPTGIWPTDIWVVSPGGCKY